MEVLSYLAAGKRIRAGLFVLLKYGGVAICLLLFLLPAAQAQKKKIRPYKTQHVVIVVIDGPRYSETWGDSSFRYIPKMANQLRRRGIFFSRFYNDGFTYTSSGHTAITTGVRQEIDNYDKQLPDHPSVFQYWLKQTGKPATAAWVIASKDKLHVLANTVRADWKDTYQPATNCGINGPGSGYRDDSITVRVARNIFAQHKPSLVLINLKEPDASGHAGNWNAYLQGITASDTYVNELWRFLQKDKYYKNKTTLLVTNDHGRHLNGIQDGFVSHGDTCEGCRHISLLALGPDFRRGKTVSATYNQTDISATIAALLGFNFDVTQGHKIPELLSK